MSVYPQQAAHLARLWDRLSGQHIALGCACNMTGLSVTLDDFERDIADYLWAESQRWGQLQVETFLLEPGAVATQEKPIRALLDRLQDPMLDTALTQWLLSRLSTTIESYAKLHGTAIEAPLLGGSSAWRKAYRV